MKVIFEKSVAGREGTQLPSLDVPEQKNLIPKELLRHSNSLPQVGEADVVRHYVALSRINYGVDNGFYPLGSCTMKYNPKINEATAGMPGFAFAHPLQPEGLSQGALRLMHELGKDL